MAAKPKPSLRDKPTEQDLRDIASPAIKAWKKLMTNLGLYDTDISRFSINNRQDEAEACFQGLLYWLQENAAVPATWETLVKALKKSNLGHIVSQTWPHLLSDSMVEQDVRRMEDKPLSQDKKVQTIMGLYLERKVFMPKNAKLATEYSGIMGELSVALDPQKSSREARLRVRGTVNETYKNIFEGILSQPSPSPDPDNLYEFISQRSDPYQPFLVEEAIKGLNKHKLKKRFTKYKVNLKAWMEEKITDFESREIVLPCLSPSEDCLAMCTSVSKDQVLLAFFYELHDYLMTRLKLDCSRLLGMQTGCTIVYFSILAVDADLLAPRILSHLTEMKEKFSLTYVVVIDHFVVDVERGTFEVLELRERVLDSGIATVASAGVLTERSSTSDRQKADQHDFNVQKFMKKYESEFLDSVEEWHHNVIHFFGPPSEREASHDVFQHIHDNGTPDMIRRLCHFMLKWSPRRDSSAYHSERYGLFKAILDDLNQQLPMSTPIPLPQSKSVGNKDQHGFDVRTFMEKYKGEFNACVYYYCRAYPFAATMLLEDFIPAAILKHHPMDLCFEAPNDLLRHILDNGTPDMIRRLCHSMMDWIPRGSSAHNRERCSGLFKTILDDLNQQLPMSTPISLPQSKSIGYKEIDETPVTAPQETPIPDKPQDPADNP